ncbi:MAG TPA: glycosyltransferase family 87 protein [Saprospiraceae bacterium]|nr:glycosyltransferase family 87 protein [Saprospiraceae bacterium]
MKHFWKDTRFIWAAYVLAAVAVSVQKLTQGGREGGYTSYENYVIFKNAFPHFVQGLNPYAAFPAEQWDLFKYSPAFALFMAPFAALPDWLGLPLWNLLNALVLLAAILKLPVLTDNQRVFMAWFVYIELITSMQNSQSNGLTAGLMLWVFIAFERGKAWQAAGYVAASAFIKIFGIFAAVLALLYPNRWKFSAWLAAWTVFLTLIPVLGASPSHLRQVYEWWWELLRNDHEASVGLSVQGWLQTWFGWMPSKTGVTLAGLVIFLLSVFAVYRAPSTVYRLPSTVQSTLACASLLIWVVIFNHKAESPTFVIAMCGVALWWCTAEKKLWEKVLLWVTFVLVSLSPTDIFPSGVRREIVQPYVLKAVPCIVIWCVITWKMLRQWGNKIAEAPNIT